MHLSEYIRQVKAGETVTINVHNHPVAQIVPIRQQETLADLASLPGVTWNGGRVAGLARGEELPASVCLADWVAEDRR